MIFTNFCFQEVFKTPTFNDFVEEIAFTIQKGNKVAQ